MEELNDKNLEQAFREAPEEIVDAIASDEVARWALEIGKNHSLHIDKVGELQSAISLAVLGVVKGDHLLSYITAKLGVPEELGKQLVSDIDEKVFRELRNRMQENDVKESEEEALLSDEPELLPPAPVEEPLDRESILHEVENPTPAVAPAALVEPVPAPELPPPAPSAVPATPIPPPSPEAAVSAPETHIAEHKLSAPFSIPPAERKDADTSIAAVKKPDPYREPIQ